MLIKIILGFGCRKSTNLEGEMHAGYFDQDDGYSAPYEALPL